MKRLFLVLLFCLLPQALPAATYYVEPTGDDARSCATATTITTPRQTVNKGIECLSGGDTLILKAGTYTESYFNLGVGKFDIPSGASTAARTKIQGQGVGVTIWNPQGGTSNISFKDGGNNIEFSNFTIDCSDVGTAGQCMKAGHQDGLRHTGWYFNNMHFKDSPDHMLALDDSDNVLIENSKFESAGNGQVQGSIKVNSIYHSGGQGNIIRNNYFVCTANPGVCNGPRIAPNNSGDAPQGGNNQIINNRLKDVHIGIISGGQADSQSLAPNVVVAENVIINSSNNAIQTFQKTLGQKIHNNTIEGTCSTGINVGSNSTDAIVVNNIIVGCTTAITNNGVNTTLSNQLTTAPTYFNAGAGDYTLGAASGTPAQGGTTVSGFSCNSNCAQGAFDPGRVDSAEIGAVSSTALVVTLTNNRWPGTLPTSSCAAGLSVTYDAVPATINSVTCPTAGQNQITLNMASAPANGSVAVRLSLDGATTVLTNNQQNGGTQNPFQKNQRYQNVTNLVVTNNVAGAPTHVFDITNYQIYDLRTNNGVLVKLPNADAAVNTPAFVIPGAPFIVASQIDATVADPPQIATVLGYIKNGGSWTAISDTPGASGVHFYGTDDNSGDIPSQGTSVAECLAGALTDVAGSTIRTASASPTVDLPINGCVTLHHIVKADPGVSAVDVFEFELRNQDTTVLNANPAVKPKVTIIGNQGSGI